MLSLHDLKSAREYGAGSYAHASSSVHIAGRSGLPLLQLYNLLVQVDAFGKLREHQTTADKFKLKYTVRMMQTAYQGLLPIVAADPAQAQVCIHCSWYCWHLLHCQPSDLGLMSFLWMDSTDERSSALIGILMDATCQYCMRSPRNAADCPHRSLAPHCARRQTCNV